jgi:hypothetical protein
MTEEPASLMLELLRQMRADLADVRTDMRSDLNSLRADVAADIHSLAADLLSTRKELGEQIVGLRCAVIEYHTSVIGHGVLIKLAHYPSASSRPACVGSSST